MTPNTEPRFRFSKLLRDASRGEVFSPGAPLNMARSINAESLKGRHEGRGRKIAGGAPKTSLSSALQKRTGNAGKLKQGRFGKFVFDTRQRAVVKVHYFSHGGGGATALRAHTRYVARDAAARPIELPPEQAAREGEPSAAEARAQAHARYLERGAELSVFYDALQDGVNGGLRASEWARDDRRHFRIILSAENGSRLAELRAYTREVMRRAELAVGTSLQWVAVDHWDTDNPHTHIVIRGRTADGRDLFLPKEFVSHGFRSIARDVATERLGKRGRDDERLALERETRAHRPTRLDRMIAAQLDVNGRIRVAALEAPNRAAEMTDALKARAHELRRLGLATEARRNIFEFTPGWQDALKAMELHLDIRKSLMRSRTQDLARTAERQLSKALRVPLGRG
ncbi:MAG: relaxase/mobilization nuclease domain-containing protein [Hyphomonadaceae bacterium]|nr:relaxase/mobilization nuclease domain-containing protein [Hyphomonadaceae bacterium]